MAAIGWENWPSLPWRYAGRVAQSSDWATKAPYLALLRPLEVHKYRRGGKEDKIVGSLAAPHNHKGKNKSIRDPRLTTTNTKAKPA